MENKQDLSQSRGYAEIDLSRFAKNVQAYRSLLGSRTRLMAVLKADAYGHGMLKLAKLAIDSGASAIGVATVDEGIALREIDIHVPILVLGRSAEKEAPRIVRYNLSQTVCDFELLEILNEEARRQGKKTHIHAKLNTGMNRIGIAEETEWKRFLQQSAAYDSIMLEGVFTHFADADNPDQSYTHYQAKRFEKMLLALGNNKARPIIHACNSAASIAYPEYHYDMVRVGIGLYGYPQVDFPKVQPVLSWKTQIAHIQKLEKGQMVSYGCTYEIKKESYIATLTVGYGDGFKRLLSNRAFVLIRGKRYPVIGRVCMDQCMVLLGELGGIAVGDEVCLIGEVGGEKIDAQEMGNWAETISYEVLLSISNRVPRVYQWNKM